MLDENDEILYTVQELAASKRLRISESTIRREIDDGNLSFYKIRGQVFVSNRHVREYLAKCETRRGDGSRFLGSSVFAYATMR